MSNHHNIEVEKVTSAGTSRAKLRNTGMSDYYDRVPSTSKASSASTPAPGLLNTLAPCLNTPAPETSPTGRSRFASKKQKEYFATVKIACVDLYLFSSTVSANMIGGEIFQNFIDKVACRAVPIPSRSTILRNLPDRYKHYKTILMQYVKENAPNIVTIIFDIWTENGGLRRSFLNIQLQFSKNFEVVNINLATSWFSVTKTGEAISKELMLTIKEWGLEGKFTVFMRDRGSNVVRAVKLTLQEVKGLSLDCFAHGLHNLIYEDLLKEHSLGCDKLVELLKKLRRIHRALSFKFGRIAKGTDELTTLKGLSVFFFCEIKLIYLFI